MLVSYCTSDECFKCYPKDKMLKAWQLISCRVNASTVKWRILLCISVRPRFHPFQEKNNRSLFFFSPSLLVDGIWRSSRPSLASLGVLCEVCWLCLHFFTPRCRLPSHHIYAERLKEHLIVVYCFGEWRTLLIHRRLFFVHLTTLLRESAGTGRQLYVIINCFEMQHPLRPYSASQVV